MAAEYRVGAAASYVAAHHTSPEVTALWRILTDCNPTDVPAYAVAYTPPI